MRERLIPVTVTERAHAVRRDGSLSSHRESWAAVSDDGVWSFHREDDDRTTWTLIHVPSGWLSLCHRSLRSARRYVTRGHAAAQLHNDLLRAIRALCCGGPVAW